MTVFVAYGARTWVAVEQDGWDAAKGSVAADGVLTWATLGMVGAPFSLAEKGLGVAGATKYMLRLGAASPDIASLSGSTISKWSKC